VIASEIDAVAGVVGAAVAAVADVDMELGVVDGIVVGTVAEAAGVETGIAQNLVGSPSRTWAQVLPSLFR